MDPIDEYEAHFQRTPMTGAGVHVVAIALGDTASAERIAEGLVGLLRERGRDASSEVVAADPKAGLPRADAFWIDTPHDLILISQAEEPWTAAHLDPLLAGIDRADHVVGRRRGGGIGRWLARLPWKFLFALPVVDVRSPYRLHRRAKLDAIPVQSRTGFHNVEILAKATFLSHLIGEEDVPEGRGLRWPRDGEDFGTVLRHPTFRREGDGSGPAEQLQGQHERDDRPGGQNQDVGPDLGEPRPLE